MSSNTSEEAPPPLCSILHELRTAENSGGYFLPRLYSLKERDPSLKLLDVGSGWGHMTASLSKIIGPSGKVTGLDIDPSTLVHARRHAKNADVEAHIEFIQGDAYSLPFADETFDITHAHQVLAHMERPWEVIREMVRVTKPGGFVAIREGDLESEVVWPKEPGLIRFHELIVKGMNMRGKGGGGADTGRRLLPWALRAGVHRTKATLSYGTWWFNGAEDKDKWAKAMVGQVRGGTVGQVAVQLGLASEEDLDEMASAWEDWAKRDDSSLAMMHGEIVIEK
ncbi:S-adenosyl-L-methionine-dependent methyltransferase [Rhypophila decipiens]